MLKDTGRFPRLFYSHPGLPMLSLFSLNSLAHLALISALSASLSASLSAAPCAAQVPCAPQLLELPGEHFTAVDSVGSTLVAYDEIASRIVPFEWTSGAWVRGTPSATISGFSSATRHFISMAEGAVSLVRGYDLGYSLTVLEKSGSTWTTTYTYSTFASGAVADPNDRHEVAISPSGLFITVGFPGDNYGAGFVDLYRKTNGAWGRITLCCVSDNGSENGYSVAMSEGRLVTSQPGSTGLTGSAFRGSLAVFTLPPGLGSPSLETMLAPPASYNGFGLEVVTDDDWIATVSRNGPQRRLDLYHRDLTGWNYFGPVLLPAPYTNKPVTGIELRGTRLIVAAAGAEGIHEYRLSVTGTTFLGFTPTGPLTEPIHRSDYGNEVDTAAGFVSRPEETLIVSYCGCAAGGGCGTPANDSAGCLNAAGTHAELRACGSTRVSVDDLVLTLDGLPANTWSTPFMGRAMSGVALQNGVLCLASPFYRYAPVPATGSTANMFGMVAQSHALHPAAAQLAAGQTWSFQTWYRDVGGPCGAASNFSNALTITFEP